MKYVDESRKITPYNFHQLVARKRKYRKIGQSVVGEKLRNLTVNREKKIAKFVTRAGKTKKILQNLSIAC